MREGIRFLVVILLFTGLCAAQARPFPSGDVQQIYQRLLSQIDKIQAFDHHAHPGYADDPDVDAMAAPPNASEALRTRDDNPELAAAAKALFGYPFLFYVWQDDAQATQTPAAGRFATAATSRS